MTMNTDDPSGDAVDPTDFAARAEWGRAARRRSPRRAHADWRPDQNRPDPVALLEEQATSRVPELIPIRHARMMVSPFTFYRGAALIMAADLAGTADSGITVQICGDAHLSNFGVFGTPERTLLVDINDFDETLPGPWEWDVKRLAASFEVAGRYRGWTEAERREITLESVRGYRERMRRAAESRVLEAWYDRLDADQVAAWARDAQREARVDKEQVKRTEALLAKARTRDSLRAFSKLVRVVDGELRIAADPPLIVPVEDLAPFGYDPKADERAMRELLRGYRTTLLAREASAAGIQLRAHGAQGRGGRQRRHPSVDRAAARARRRRPAAAPGEGGPGVGARAIPRAERVCRARRAGRAGGSA